MPTLEELNNKSMSIILLLWNWVHIKSEPLLFLHRILIIIHGTCLSQSVVPLSFSFRGWQVISWRHPSPRLSKWLWKVLQSEGNLIIYSPNLTLQSPKVVLVIIIQSKPGQSWANQNAQWWPCFTVSELVPFQEPSPPCPVEAWVHFTDG